MLRNQMFFCSHIEEHAVAYFPKIAFPLFTDISMSQNIT